MSQQKMIEILSEMKQANPWVGTVDTRKQKFLQAFEKIKQLYRLHQWQLVFEVSDDVKHWYNSGMSRCRYDTKTIFLAGRLSVITFLHEIAHARGLNQQQAQQYAVRLFSKVWADKFAKLSSTPTGMMIKKQRS